VNAAVQSIVFFLNIYNNNEYSGDFSGIPYAYIRMFEGTPDRPPRQVFAQYNVATQQNCVGMRALVMGRLYRVENNWKFCAIGDAFADPSILQTISRVIKDYSR
jgi:stress protein